MSSHIDYKKLTNRELELLILADDDDAVDEHIRRIKAGEAKPTRTYTLEDLEKMIADQKNNFS